MNRHFKGIIPKLFSYVFRDPETNPFSTVNARIDGTAIGYCEDRVRPGVKGQLSGDV